VNLVAYDKNKKKHLILGSSSTTIFNENGVLLNNKVEMFIWPLYKTDPRIICTDPYHGKYHLKNKAETEINKNDYCIIYLEFQKFSKPIIYSLKSPQSYREFLRIKNPNGGNVNTMSEITSLYENSFESLDKIVNSLRNRDEYFLQLDKKRKEKERERTKKMKDKLILTSETIIDDIYLDEDKTTLVELRYIQIIN